ncbi:MAG: flagellar biosynthesis anti-sigma factor FlgM [Neptuniibacter sp.]
MVIDQLGQLSQSTTTRTKTSEPQSSTAKSSGGSASAAAPSNKGDTVQLSEAAKALQNVEKKLADTPEVDSARVEKLKQDIESGNYQINADRIAERFLSIDSMFE